MKAVQRFLCLASVVLVSACGGAKVTIDYDNTADFSQYSTFAYEEGTPVTDNPLVDQRIVAAIGRHLAQEGLQKIDSNPDLRVTYHVSLGQQSEYYTTGYGYGVGPGWRWGGYGGMGTTTTTEVSYTVGTLVVDIWDASDKQLVFRGSASGTVSEDPRKSTENINKVMNQIFENYPPGQ